MRPLIFINQPNYDSKNSLIVSLIETGIDIHNKGSQGLRIQPGHLTADEENVVDVGRLF